MPAEVNLAPPSVTVVEVRPQFAVTAGPVIGIPPAVLHIELWALVDSPRLLILDPDNEVVVSARLENACRASRIVK